MAIINMISGKVPMTYRGMKTMLLIQGSSAYGNSISSSNVNNFKTVGRGTLSGTGRILDSVNSNGVPTLAFNKDTFIYSDPALIIGRGPFTVECFWYVAMGKYTPYYFIKQSPWLRLLGSSAMGGTDYIYVSNTQAYFSNSFSVVNGSIHHVAYVGNGTQTDRSVKFYIDGILRATCNCDYNLDFTLFGVNGSTYGAGATTDSAYFTELRISNIARYTGDFTPPTAPFAPD